MGGLKMKRKWFFVIGVVVLSVITFSNVSLADNPIKLIINGKEIKTDVLPQIIDGRAMVPVRWFAEGFNADVQWDEENKSILINAPKLDLLQRQVDLLERSMAPKTPREAVERWAEGIKERNGALQYAVLSPELKEQKRSYYEDCGWVTGVSSPWVESYEIFKENELEKGLWEYEVIFKMMTSTGEAGTNAYKVAVKEYKVNADHPEGWYIVKLEEVK